MTTAANYYRWLSGVPELTETAAVNDALQAFTLIQALRQEAGLPISHAPGHGFEKPEGMSDDLWDLATSTGNHHNISGTLPGDAWQAVQFWITEGKIGSPNPQLGHRLAILQPDYHRIDFGDGAATRTTRGYSDPTTQKLTVPLAPYPAPGVNFAQDNPSSLSAWSAYVNLAQLVPVVDGWASYPPGADPNTYVNPAYEAMSVKITHLATGQVETRSVAERNLRGYAQFGGLLHFNGPTSTSEFYDGDYRVEISGLQDAATGKCVTVVYEVDFIQRQVEAKPVALSHMNKYSLIQLAPATPESLGNEANDYPWDSYLRLFPRTASVSTGSNSGAEADIARWTQTIAIFGYLRAVTPTVVSSEAVTVPAAWRTLMERSMSRRTTPGCVASFASTPRLSACLPARRSPSVLRSPCRGSRFPTNGADSAAMGTRQSSQPPRSARSASQSPTRTWERTRSSCGSPSMSPGRIAVK